MTPKDYFDKNGYVVLTNSLTKPKCDELVDHMFKLYDEGKLVKDAQCPLSDSVYGDSIFDNLLAEMAGPIGTQIGKKLLPTYTYARIYRRGEELKPHKDRPACEISATITLGYDAKKLWRIFFDEEKETAIDLDIGEMAVYKGCEIEHWRTPFKGEWHVQLFLHYVDANGPHASHALDGRQKLGVDKTTNKPNSTIPVKYFNPIFNSIIIPSNDREVPGYFCIDKSNMPELTFTDQECDKIISNIQQLYPSSASVGGTVETSKITRDIRSAKIYVIDNDNESKWLYSKVATIVSVVNNNYYDFDIAGITHGLQLIEYSSDKPIKDHYGWHVDCGPGEPATRKLSFTVQLTDPRDYEECNLVINNYCAEVTATRERGSVHIFPSYMPHTVTPITKGTRYALVIWVHGTRRFR